MSSQHKTATLPTQLRVQQLANSIIVKLADVSVDEQNQMQPVGDIHTMSLTPVQTQLTVQQVADALHYYDQNRGTQLRVDGNVIRLQEPDADGDADVYDGDLRLVDELMVHECACAHTHAAHAVQWRQQRRPSHAYPSYWYCRECRNAARWHVATQTNIQHPHDELMKRYDDPIEIATRLPAIVVNVGDDRHIVLNGTAAQIMVNVIRYLYYAQSVSPVDETSIALWYPVSRIRRTLIANNVRFGDNVERSLNATVMHIYASVALSPVVMTKVHNRIVSDECATLWMDHGVGELAPTNRHVRAHMIKLSVPAAAGEHKLTFKAVQQLQMDNRPFDCERDVCFFTEREQDDHARRRLKGRIVSLDDESNRASMCVACDISLRDKCVGTRDVVDGNNGPGAQAPPVYKRPPLQLFLDDEMHTVSIESTDRCSTALVANAFAYFSRTCHSLAPEHETAIACAVKVSVVRECVERAKKPAFDANEPDSSARSSIAPSSPLSADRQANVVVKCEPIHPDDEPSDIDNAVADEAADEEDQDYEDEEYDQDDEEYRPANKKRSRR